MPELRQTIKNELILKKNISNLYSNGLITKELADNYLELIQNVDNHTKVIDELDKIIRLASAILDPLNSTEELHEIILNKKEGK